MTSHWSLKRELLQKMFLVTQLTHWGRVTHICVSKLTIIGSDNGLSPGRRQAIIWTNAGILLIRTLGTNFSEILSKIHAFSFKKMHLKTSSAKWRPFCFGLNVLRSWSSKELSNIFAYLHSLRCTGMAIDGLLANASKPNAIRIT